MLDLSESLLLLTGLCLQIVGLAWLVGAVFFASRLQGGARRKVVHFFRSLLPEPWLLVLLPAYFLAVRLVPHQVWRHLAFWNPALAVLGAAIVVLSTLLMLWARWVLGAMWAGRPMVQEGHELRRHGPYGIVRHPIYTGMAGLALGGWLVAGAGQLVALLVFMSLFVAWRVWAEERMMVATFGDAYRQYRQAVPALVPLAARSRARGRKSP